jgi:hypothetical protein
VVEEEAQNVDHLVIGKYVAFKALKAKKIGLVAGINREEQGVSVRPMAR